jgi:uncharacterized protein (DUF58 family)
MLPTPRLMLLVMAAAPFFLAGALYDPFTAIGVLYLLVLILCGLLDLFFLPRRRQFTITRTLPSRVSLNVATKIIYEIHNQTRRNVQIQLAEVLPPELQAQPAHCTAKLDPNRRARLEGRILAKSRGRFELAAVDVRILPRLGLFFRQFRLALPAEIHVFPNLVNIRRYDLLIRRGLAWEQGLMHIRQIGQGSEFESLRHYTPGDDMSRVDWKATAKRSQLIVKNYEPERQQSVLVALDVGRATAGEFEGISRLDYFVNAALMLAFTTLRQGDLFSLVAFSNRIESYLPPVRGLKNIDRVARALYELEPRLVEADYGAACRFLSLKNRKRSLICLMTDVINRQASEVVIAYLARFARYHLPLAVTLYNPEIRALAHQPLAEDPDPYPKAVALDLLAAREEALTAMRRLGIGVLDVHPKNLTPELINRYIAIKSTLRL